MSLFKTIVIVFFVIITESIVLANHNFSIGGSFGPYNWHSDRAISSSGMCGELNVGHQFEKGKFILSSEIFFDKFILNENNTHPTIEMYGLKVRPGIKINDDLAIFGIIGILGSRDYIESNIVSTDSAYGGFLPRSNNTKEHFLSLSSGVRIVYKMSPKLSCAFEYRFSVPPKIVNFATQVAHIYMLAIPYQINERIVLSAIYFHVQLMYPLKVQGNSISGAYNIRYPLNNVHLSIFLLGIDFIF